MARSVVYRSFEVRDGWDSNRLGCLHFESESRAAADEALEALTMQGVNCQLFGIKSENGEGSGERVLLRMLVGRRAA